MQRLILINVVAFAVQLILNVPFGQGFGGLNDPAPGGLFTRYLHFDAALFFGGFVYMPISYQFLHASLSHLFWNMLMLYFFGPTVEREYGTRRFYTFYLWCGAAGVLATLLPVLLGAPLARMAPVVGASGAIMGVLVAFALSDLERRLYFLFVPFPINARALLIIVLALNLLPALLGGGADVSILTHLGGMGAGYLFVKLAPRVEGVRIRLPQFKRREKRAADPGGAPKGHTDKVGKAVDNIFKFNDKRRR